MAEQVLTKGQEWPRRGEWTVEDFNAYLETVEDDGRRYELIGGILYVTNTPSLPHQYTVLAIARRLSEFAETNDLGDVLTAPCTVHLSDEAPVVQPDVFFFKAGKWPAEGDDNTFDGVPDLVVEVLSPGTQRRDRTVKFNAYEQAGVPEYWVANPKTRSVEVFTLSGREYALMGEFVADEVIQSKVLEGLAIVTSVLFRT